ncbi:MAG: FAD-dependent oxidoreductase [Ornithinimicrobium sp.]
MTSTEPDRQILERGYRDLSFWLDSMPEPLGSRPSLEGDLDVDVAIVGAGYTGLWTAYYLAALDPDVRIAVVDKEIAGFGASGRNGGWCSALFPVSAQALAEQHGRPRARAMSRVMQDTVDEVGRVSAKEGLDCHFRKGGTIVGARTRTQWIRARREVEAAYAIGLSDEDLVLLGPTEAAERVGMADLLGATYTPHCAALHPARLVRGLADIVERQGVQIFENTEVLAVHDGLARTRHGRIRAEVVVRATEGYTATLPGWGRDLAPVYSMMLATAPLPPSAWERIGLRAGETFSDHRNLVIYGQRTADDRLAFGGRGAPHHLGSRIDASFDRDASVQAGLSRTLASLFPDVEIEVTHTWGGPLGVPRDWYPSVGLDRSKKFAWAGGYVGDGVGTSNLAGRTLADLIGGRESRLTRLPWVGHQSPRWEPEPLRWAGINLGRWLARSADATENRTGQPSRQGALLYRLTR